MATNEPSDIICREGAVRQNGTDEWLDVIPRRFVEEKIRLANGLLVHHEP
jgi:hypothetical protein